MLAKRTINIITFPKRINHIRLRFKYARFFISFTITSFSNMKVIVLGESVEDAASNYTSLLLQEAKQQKNKYGKTFYLMERIFLIQKDSVADYATWKSEKEEVHLALTITPELKNEIDAISNAILKQHPGMTFKKYDGKIFIKMGKDCPAPPLNCEIQFTLQVYGAFTQSNTGVTFLQMEVHELCSKKMSLLSKYVGTNTTPTASLNYVPNSNRWEDDDSQ